MAGRIGAYQRAADTTLSRLVSDGPGSFVGTIDSPHQPWRFRLPSASAIGSQMSSLDTLREELMRLHGVADADVDASNGATLAGVRVRLLPGVDPRSVGVQVQRLLASYGLRSRVSDDEVVTVGEPITTAAPGGTSEIQSVSVDEARDGVRVTVVTTDGESFTATGDLTGQGVTRAVAEAVGRMMTGSPVTLVWSETSGPEGSTAISVVVERSDGSRAAGASLVRAGLAAAAARAVWNALR